MKNWLQQRLHRHRAWRASLGPRESIEMPPIYLLLMLSLLSFIAFGLAIALPPAAFAWVRIADQLGHIPLMGWLTLIWLAALGVIGMLCYEFARAHGRAFTERMMRPKRTLRHKSRAAERLRQQRLVKAKRMR